MRIGTTEPPPGPYILAVGDLRRKKNFGRLVEAFARAARRRPPAPARDRRHATRARASALRAPGVELPGYVPEDDLDALMRGADLLVHPEPLRGLRARDRRGDGARHPGRRRARDRAARDRRRRRAATSTRSTWSDIADTIRRALADEEPRRARARARGRTLLGRRRRPDRRRLPRAPVTTTILLISTDRAAELRHSLPAALAQDGRRGRRARQRLERRDRGELAREHGARHLRLERRLSWAAANNAGIAAAEGDSVLLLNADCFLEPDFLDARARARSPSRGVGCGGAEARAHARARARRTGSTCSTPPACVMDRAAQEQPGRPRPARASPTTRPGEAFGADGAAALYRREMLEDCAVDGEVLDPAFEKWASDVDLAWRAPPDGLELRVRAPGGRLPCPQLRPHEPRAGAGAGSPDAVPQPLPDDAQERLPRLARARPAAHRGLRGAGARLRAPARAAPAARLRRGARAWLPHARRKRREIARAPRVDRAASRSAWSRSRERLPARDGTPPAPAALAPRRTTPSRAGSSTCRSRPSRRPSCCAGSSAGPRAPSASASPT